MPDNMPKSDIPEVGLADALIDIEEEKTELDKIFELLLAPQNIGHNTELTQNEITAFSMLETFYTRHNIPVLQQYVLTNKVLRVSKGRKGRAEIVKISSRHAQMEAQGLQQPPGRWSRMFQRRR